MILLVLLNLFVVRLVVPIRSYYWFYNIFFFLCPALFSNVFLSPSDKFFASRGGCYYCFCFGLIINVLSLSQKKTWYTEEQ